VNLVVPTLSTVLYFHPSIIPPVIKSRLWWKLVSNCSLRVFCNGAKLVGTLQVIQICFLMACCWGELGCTYSINRTLFPSIHYSSSYQIWAVMEASLQLCSLWIFCNGVKLVGTLQVIQIRFLMACCLGELGCTYSINRTLFPSIPYSSSYQIWAVMEASLQL
jgi:hypothetical protein